MTFLVKNLQEMLNKAKYMGGGGIYTAHFLYFALNIIR